MNNKEKIWPGSFGVWQNREFGALHARFSRQKVYFIGDFQVLASAKPILGITTLYCYCLPPGTEIIAAIEDLARRIGAAKIRIYSVDRIPPIESFSKEEFLTLVMDLDMSGSKLWKGIGNKTRNMVRKGVKDGIAVKLAQTEKEFQDWWNVYRRITAEKKFPPQNFRLVEGLFKNRELSRLFISTKGGRVVGGSFFLLGRCPLYWLGAFDKNYPSGYVNIWEAALSFQKDGCALLDLGGISASIADGSTVFKKHFSGRVEKGYFYEIPISKLKNCLLDFLIFCKKITKI